MHIPTFTVFSQGPFYIFLDLRRKGLVRRSEGLGGVDDALPWDLENSVPSLESQTLQILSVCIPGCRFGLTLVQRHCPIGADWPTSVSSGHRLLRRDGAPVSLKSTVCPAGPGNVMWCGMGRFRVAEAGSSYLQEVRDIRIDFVDESDAIVKDGGSLIGMKSGLDR